MKVGGVLSWVMYVFLLNVLLYMYYYLFYAGLII